MTHRSKVTQPESASPGCLQILQTASLGSARYPHPTTIFCAVSRDGAAPGSQHGNHSDGFPSKICLNLKKRVGPGIGFRVWTGCHDGGFRSNRTTCPQRSNRTTCPQRSNRTTCPQRSNRTTCPQRSKRTTCPQRSKRTTCPQRSKRTTCPQRSKRTTCPQRLTRIAYPEPQELRRCR